MGKIKRFAMLVLMLSAVNAWGTAFKDDFNRADGNVGNGWATQTNGTIEVKIVGNEVLITGTQATDWARCGISRDVVGESKVSCDFKAGESFNFHIRVDDADTSAFFEVYTWGGPLIQANSPDGGWPGWTDITGSNIVAGEYNNVVVELAGNDLIVTLNDTVVGTFTNASFTRIGSVLISSDSAAGTTGTLHIDNVEIGDFVGGVAKEPNPAHEASDVPRETALSWTPGELADTHDVYFGTTFKDVNDASRTNPLSVLAKQGQSESTYKPERLAFETTYYWRIDEVNAPPDNAIFKGDVWSFTTEPFAYPIDGANITATASSVSQANFGPEKTVDGSGLDADDLHSTEPMDMWISGNELQGAWLQYEFDKVYKLHEMWVWNSNQILEGLFGFGFKDVTIEYSTNGTDWTALGGVVQFTKAPGTAGYAHDTTVDLGGATAKYIKLTASSNWGGILPQYSLSEVRFFYIPVIARAPSPASGAADVAPDATLAWRTGREAATHNVYLSDDLNAVANGGAPVATVTDAIYNSTLNLASTYFWRIDEVNETETPTTWQGNVWIFSTSESLAVDDFESYNDIDPPDPKSNRIFESWIDGYGVATNGALVGYDPPQPSYAETATLHSGKQAMPLFYGNTGGATYSEAQRTFASGQDWTKHGIQTLGLWFHGAAGNTGQLYIKINGVKVSYDSDASNLATSVWQPWNIDLTALGTNLASVTTLAIGIDGNGAAGTLYFDDIGLSAYARQLVTPVQPDPAGLVAQFAFEGNANDSVGGHNGTPNGGPTYSAGHSGQAITLDGTDDYVVVGSVGISGAAPRTIAGWAKASSLTFPSWVDIFGFTGPSGNDGHFDIELVGNTSTTTLGWYGIHVYGWEYNILKVDSEWHHLAASYDGTTIKWYGDGLLIGSNSSRTPNTPDNVHIGKRQDNTNYFPGSVDDVQIFSRALSDAEIAGLAGRTSPFDGPLSRPLVEVKLEAEAADPLGVSWRSYDDPNASGGKAIGSETGDGNDYDYAPGADWTATYSFTVPATGEYKIVLRAQETGNDSFWVRVPTAVSQTHEDPDQPGTGWVRFNGIDAPNGWAWDEVHSDDHNQAVVTWVLAAGDQTLEIAKREEGVQLDAILITNDLD